MQPRTYFKSLQLALFDGDPVSDWFVRRNMPWLCSEQDQNGQNRLILRDHDPEVTAH